MISYCMSTPHQTTLQRLSGKYEIRLVRDCQKNSSNQEIFEKSKAEYEEALSKCGYSTKLSYSYHMIYLTITTLATGLATPRLSLTITQIKTESAV